MNISDIIGLIPTGPSVPIFDGCNWGYVLFADYSQGVRDCVNCAFITGLLQSSDGTIIIAPCDLMLGNITGLIHLALVGSILEIGDYLVDLSGLLNPFMFNIFDGSNGFPVSLGKTLVIKGLDGLTFNVSGIDEIEIGLPTPDAQYFVPGRCVPSPGVAAQYIGHVAGMVTDIIITADNVGILGNITFIGDGVTTIGALIIAWNIAYPGNTMTLSAGDGTQIPDSLELMHLSGGGGPITCQPGDYQPFNKWLVLTWDNCHQTSLWLPPQCCIQTLTFNGNTQAITLNSGGHMDNGYYCTCGGCTPVGCNCLPGSNVSIIVPSAQPLPSINTDNQKLTLTDDCPNSQMLCLSRWHGGTLGVQIADPDSCVDLIEINSHTWDLQGNMLYLLGSDGLVNDVVDLSQVNEHTLGLIVDPIDPLHYHDPLFPRDSLLDIYGCDLVSNDQVNLINVASEILYMNGWNLCVQKQDSPTPGCTPCLQQCINLEFLNTTCEDVMDCMCGARIDRVDEGVTPTGIDACTFVPPLPAGPTACADWGIWPNWVAQVYYKNQRVIHVGKRWAALADTTAGDVPGVSVLWGVISNSLWPNDAYETFFSLPRSVGEIEAFLASRIGGLLSSPCGGCCGGGSNMNVQNINIEGDINTLITNITTFITGQKYCAIIRMTANQTFWSQHTAYSGNYNDPRNQRWFIPNFDKTEGWHSNNSSMISTDWIPGSPFENHNEIAPDAGSLGTCSIPDIGFSKDFGTVYSQTPSTNNPQAAADSRFCRYGAKTITIVKDGYYQISLQGVMQIDHNVHAFRYSCLRYNSRTDRLDLIIDSKFGGGSSVGSSSLNDPLVPRTNEYHGGGTKILLLYAGDVLFPAVKISPQTIRPKQQNSAATKDVLHEIDENVAPVYGEHTPGSASGLYVSWSAGYVIWNFNLGAGGQSISTDEFGWPAANLPNVIPHFFTPSGGQDGAQNYGRNLLYAGGYNAGGWDDYRYDDGVLTLYGPSSRWNSDGSGGTEGESRGASLSVHRVNSRQGDEEDYIPLP